jgi:hypothetical protein
MSLCLNDKHPFPRHTRGMVPVHAQGYRAARGVSTVPWYYQTAPFSCVPEAGVWPNIREDDSSTDYRGLTPSLRAPYHRKVARVPA